MSRIKERLNRGKLDKELRQLAVPAAKISETSEPCMDVTGSFTHGVPYFEVWPVCTDCGCLMCFILQLASKDHEVETPKAWNLLVLFACQEECCGRGCDGISDQTIMVHTYSNPSPDKSTEPKVGDVRGQRHRLRFEPALSLPDFTTVKRFDPIGIPRQLKNNQVIYYQLKSRICPLKFSFVGGWPEWDNLSDMTPVTEGRRWRHILQINEAIGDGCFYEQASLFGDANGAFRLVYDGKSHDFSMASSPFAA